jgi:hypothetical protein
MEPKALTNLDGSLVESETPKQIFSPTEEFLNFSSSVSSHGESKTPKEHNVMDDETMFLKTPTPASFDQQEGNFSPTTPYYMAQGAKLLQQTCPPKQSSQSLFPLSGNIDDQPNEGIRKKLLQARRKSMQWAPKVASPLGKPINSKKL